MNRAPVRAASPLRRRTPAGRHRRARSGDAPAARDHVQSGSRATSSHGQRRTALLPLVLPRGAGEVLPVSSSRDVPGGPGGPSPGRRERRLSSRECAPQTHEVLPTDRGLEPAVSWFPWADPGRERTRRAGRWTAIHAGPGRRRFHDSVGVARARPDGDRCHATCRNSYTFKSRWRSRRTASRDPSCRSMCDSFRPVSRRKSRRAMP